MVEDLAHDPDHPGPQRRIAGGNGHQLAHGLPASAPEPPEKLSVVEEEHPQHLRNRERPQAVPDLLGEERAEERTALGRARRTEPPSLTGEGDEVLGPALGAAHPREAAVEDAAVEKAVGRVLDTAAPEAEAALEVLLPAPLDLVVAGVDEPIQRRVARAARAVEGC